MSVDGVDIRTTEWGINLGDVQERRIEWLSYGRVARGKISDLSGDGGQGKTLMLLDWVARVSSGRDLPGHDVDKGDYKIDKRHVIYMSLEDDVNDTITPRLRIAGADLPYVTVFYKNPVTGKVASFPDDTDDILRHMEALDTQLLCIDPFAGFMGRGLKDTNGQDIREAYQRLADGIKDMGASAIWIRHLTKGSVGGSAAYRASGSVQIGALARVGMTVAKSQNDPRNRICAPNKENLTQRVRPLAFTFDDIPGEQHPRVRWLGETDEGADDILMSPQDRRAMTDAVEMMRDMLADGPRNAGDVQREMKKMGVSEHFIREAKDRLLIDVKREGARENIKWWWSLPRTPGVEDDFPTF